jgi:hypothetical protein
LVNGLVEVVKGLDWYQIGYTVGEMLSGVDWLSVLNTAKNAIWQAFKGFWNGLMSDGKNFLVGWIGKIKGFFSADWGPLVGVAIGAALTATLGLLSKTIQPILFGWFNGLGAYARKSKTPFVQALFNFVKPIEETKKSLEAVGLEASFKNVFYSLTNTVKPLGKVVGVLEKLGKAIFSFKGIGVITAVVIALSSAYGGLGGAIKRVGEMFGQAFEKVKIFADSIGFSDKINALKESFKKLYDILAVLKPVWEVVFTFGSTVVEAAINTIIGAISACIEVVTGVIDIITGVLETLGGLVIGLLTGDFQTFWTGINTM